MAKVTSASPTNIGFVSIFLIDVCVLIVLVANGWDSKGDCKDKGMNQGANHDKCCGTYPDRRAYDSENLMCCDGKLTGNTIC